MTPDIIAHAWEGITSNGPLHFRVIMQPLVAVILATNSALHDARAGRAPFSFFGSLIGRDGRRAMLHALWTSVGNVFVMATVVDCLYQYIVSHRIHISQALVAAIILALIPYLLIRGPLTSLIELFKPDRISADTPP